MIKIMHIRVNISKFTLAYKVASAPVNLKILKNLVNLCKLK